MNLRELDRLLPLLAESIDSIVLLVKSPANGLTAQAKPSPAKRIENLIYNIGIAKRRLQRLRRSAQKAPYVEPKWGKLIGRPVKVIAFRSASMKRLNAQATQP